jgi:hypothetical protein
VSASRLKDAIASASSTVSSLNGLSEHPCQNPYTTVEWPEKVDPEREWFSSPELLSLYRTPVWGRLDETTRSRLAFHEAANFCSLNVHGDKSMVQQLAVRLYRRDLTAVTDHLHSVLDEKDRDRAFFAGFCKRYARIYPSRQVSFEQSRPRDVEDFLFFAKAMIFEEIVDRYNWSQGRDARLHPVARFINNNHHFEQSRWLVFGRRIVQELWESCAPDWDRELIDDVRQCLAASIVAIWREYYNPDVYADTGLDRPWEIAEEAWSASAQREHRRRMSAKCVRHLLSTGILSEEPDDAF